MTDIRALIFDLYGTLVYLSAETKPYVRLFADLGVGKDENLIEVEKLVLLAKEKKE